MINPKQRARLQRAINRLVKATVEVSRIGAGDPADAPEIEAELARARALLRRTLDSLTVENGQ